MIDELLTSHGRGDVCLKQPVNAELPASARRASLNPRLRPYTAGTSRSRRLLDSFREELRPISEEINSFNVPSKRMLFHIHSHVSFNKQLVMTGVAGSSCVLLPAAQNPQSVMIKC